MSAVWRWVEVNTVLCACVARANKITRQNHQAALVWGWEKMRWTNQDPIYRLSLIWPYRGNIQFVALPISTFRQHRDHMKEGHNTRAVKWSRFKIQSPCPSEHIMPPQRRRLCMKTHPVTCFSSHHPKQNTCERDDVEQRQMIWEDAYYNCMFQYKDDLDPVDVWRCATVVREWKSVTDAKEPHSTAGLKD